MSGAVEVLETAGSRRSVHAETLGRMVLEACRRHSGVALRQRRGDALYELTYEELGLAAREIARGLAALGIRPGDRVAIIGNTRPEWTLTDCGVLCSGATTVPVYHTNSAEETRYVLEHSGARAIICEDAAQVAKVAEVRDRLPALEHVLAMTSGAGAPSLDDVRALAADIDPEMPDRAVAEMQPDDVASFIYTSGTTGPPKGCMLTHRNWLSATDQYESRLDMGDEEVVIFLFLPLAHSLARITQMLTLDVGGTLAYWQGDPATLLDDIADAAPTHFPSVPRVFEKIRDRALDQVESASAAQRAVFEAALSIGRRARAADRRGERQKPALRAAHRLADRLVLSKVRGLFGDRLEMALTGAAPIAVEVLRFFDACGVLVLEGYGLTESTAAGTVNTPGEHRFGSVGRLLPGNDVRIGADGEILLHGPSIFAGYHDDPSATAEALHDGWLATGDLGAVDADGYIHVTGRKKDLIITSSGKNITPTNIELALRECRWVSQAVVYGDNRPYLVALLTLDPEEGRVLAERLGIPFDLAAMARDERVREELQQAVDEVNQRFARIEQIKRFAILDHDLSQAGGELTPTLKVKRGAVYDHYRNAFEAMYG